MLVLGAAAGAGTLVLAAGGAVAENEKRPRMYFVVVALPRSKQRGKKG